MDNLDNALPPTDSSTSNIENPTESINTSTGNAENTDSSTTPPDDTLDDGPPPMVDPEDNLENTIIPLEIDDAERARNAFKLSVAKFLQAENNEEWLKEIDSIMKDLDAIIYNNATGSLAPTDRSIQELSDDINKSPMVLMYHMMTYPSVVEKSDYIKYLTDAGIVFRTLPPFILAQYLHNANYAFTYKDAIQLINEDLMAGATSNIENPTESVNSYTFNNTPMIQYLSDKDVWDNGKLLYDQFNDTWDKIVDNLLAYYSSLNTRSSIEVDSKYPLNYGLDREQYSILITRMLFDNKDTFVLTPYEVDTISKNVEFDYIMAMIELNSTLVARSNIESRGYISRLLSRFEKLKIDNILPSWMHEYKEFIEETDGLNNDTPYLLRDYLTNNPSKVNLKDVYNRAINAGEPDSERHILFDTGKEDVYREIMNKINNFSMEDFLKRRDIYIIMSALDNGLSDDMITPYLSNKTVDRLSTLVYYCESDDKSKAASNIMKSILASDNYRTDRVLSPLIKMVYDDGMTFRDAIDSYPSLKRHTSAIIVRLKENDSNDIKHLFDSILINAEKTVASFKKRYGLL